MTEYVRYAERSKRPSMKVSEKFPHIAKFEIFDDLPKSFVRDFVDRCTVRHIRKRTLLLAEGAYPDACYLIAYGTLDVYSTSNEGQRVLLHRGGEGLLIGEMETIADRVCVASCETGETATVISISKSLLFEATRNPIFLRNMTRLQYDRLDRSKQFKVIDSCYPIDQRLAAYLRYLGERGPIISENQNFMAELIGCSRQTINRELKVLRDEGIIATHNSRIEILDPEKLDELAQTRLLA